MESITDKGYKLYIGGLSDIVTKEDIEEEFTKYGEINDIWIARNPPGFAFVFYKNLADADKALKTLDGSTFFGSQIKVEYAKNTGKRNKTIRPNKTGPDVNRNQPGRFFDNSSLMPRGNNQRSNSGLYDNNMMINRNMNPGKHDNNQVNIDLLKNILKLVENTNPYGSLNNANHPNPYDEPRYGDPSYGDAPYGDTSYGESSFGRRIRDRSPVGTRNNVDRRFPRDNNPPVFNGRNNSRGRNFNNNNL